MAIRVECPQKRCSKSLKVKEEYAGKKVKCPGCGTAVRIPAPAGPVASPAAATGGAGGAEAAPAAAASFWEILDRKCRANRLDARSRNLFAAGLAALFFLAFSTLFRWWSFQERFENVEIAGSVTGIQMGTGMLIFLFSLAAGSFAGFAFYQKPAWFALSVRAAAAWGSLTFLSLLVQLLQAGSGAGVGLILGVLASLAAAMTLGCLALQQLSNK
jgi:hypothetical protein